MYLSSIGPLRLFFYGILALRPRVHRPALPWETSASQPMRSGRGIVDQSLRITLGSVQCWIAAEEQKQPFKPLDSSIAVRFV